jgi:hypothetical protein
MSNLTISENLVREVPLAPLPAHALVVYKMINGGRTYQAELSPEQQFQEEKTSWWKRFRSDPPSYLAYAVNLNEQLRLQFSRRVLLQNQVDVFDLIFKLKYHVSSPRRVVERLSEDPLLKLQNEIIDLVTVIVSNEEWDAIRDRFNIVADKALAHTQDEIFDQAVHWGFAVDSLRLERQLPEGVIDPIFTKREKDLEIEKRRFEAEAEKKRASIEYQKTLHQATLEHESTLHKGGLEARQQEAHHGHTLQQEEREYELKKLELKHQDSLRRQEEESRMARMVLENLLTDNELMRQIKAGGADAAVEAFKNIAGETNSPRQLEEVFNVLRRLKQLSGGDGGGAPASDAQSLGGLNISVGLLSAPNGEGGCLPKVAQLLSSSFQAVGAVSYTAEEKTRLLSAMAHLAAEAMLGEEADDDKLKAYRERLLDVVSRLNFVPRELEDFIQENYRGLKERLK